jgi:predicted DNA-binding transcriptional regulator YafY
MINRLRAGQPLTAGDAAAEFEVSLRTIYRDLDFLRDQLDAPLEYDAQQHSYVLTEKTYSLPPLALSEGELSGLFFAEQVVRQYHGTPYEADLRSALRKLEQSLPDEVTIDPNPLGGFLSLDLGPTASPAPETFARVVDAASRRRRLKMRYTSLTRGGKTADRIVDPYRVYNLRGDWYLAAFDHRRGRVLDFALHRIRALEILEEGYPWSVRCR